MNHSQYAELIAQIKRKRRWIMGLTLAAIWLIVILTSPIEIIIMNQPILLWGGCSPWVTAVLIILCLGIEVIAIAMVSGPLHTSMDEECDPHKHLILNMALNSNQNMDPIYANDYLYLGDFLQAMVYAQKMSASKQDTMALAGFFNQARCAFFLGDGDALAQATVQYADRLAACKKLHPKIRIAYEQMNEVISFMVAMSRDDAMSIDALRGGVKAWNTNKATEGFVNYLKGVAADQLADREEAIYRFKAVQEHCSKTVFAKLAEEYLMQLQ